MIGLYIWLLAVRIGCSVDLDHEEWSTEYSLLKDNVVNCNIERWNSLHLTQNDFERRYAYSEPVVIDNIENIDFRRLTRKAELLKTWGSVPITLNSANSYSYQREHTTLQEYVSNRLGTLNADRFGNETMYLFGDIDPEIWAPLLKNYKIPRWNLPQHQPALGFGIGGSGSGVPFHFHGPVFAEVIHGSKLWFLYSYENRPDFDPNASSLNWFLTKFRLLDGQKLALQCVLFPGQVLYIPDKWWHATLNLETSVFISTFLSPTQAQI